jgi:RNA polymerase sigma factor (TIGR02999 family)
MELVMARVNENAMVRAGASMSGAAVRQSSRGGEHERLRGYGQDTNPDFSGPPMLVPAFAHALDARSPLHTSLRGLADRLLQRERRSHTLQATALLHEACLRIRRLPAGDYTRGAILDLFGQAMRRVLVDHARRRRCRLRADAIATRRNDAGEGDDVAIGAPGDAALVAALVGKLAVARPRAAKVVELRFFAGMAVAEVAAHLGITERTVVRDWAAGREWLRERLAEDVTP